MTDSVIVTTVNDTVVVTGDNTYNVVTDTTPSYNIITEGIQGPPGPSGLGGYATGISTPIDGDLLSYSTTSNAWVNVRREEVCDGGNF